MNNAIKRKLVGIVTSNKMNKTVIVKVESVKVHPKYHKRYKVFKKFPAHADSDLAVGDKVVIEESKPYSKTVNWKVISRI
jgi:small subunit ribosomal protein S17